MKYNISHKYFKFEMDISIPMFKGRYNGSLGNMSDAGWFWDFDDYTLLIALIHIAKSRIKNDFVFEFNKNQLPFEILKMNILSSLKNSFTYEYLFQLLTGWSYDKLFDELNNYIEFHYNGDDDLQKMYYQKLSDNYITLQKKVLKEARFEVVDIFKKNISKSDNISKLLDNLAVSSELAEEIILEVAVYILKTYL